MRKTLSPNAGKVILFPLTPCSAFPPKDVDAGKGGAWGKARVGGGEQVGGEVAMGSLPPSRDPNEPFHKHPSFGIPKPSTFHIPSLKMFMGMSVGPWG